ncbi:MAG: NAD(+) synthase [Clostridia bacterium]|jgi:NAD+ synthase|nr:NAD(+) synthase [Clostridia bacterium]
MDKREIENIKNYIKDYLKEAHAKGVVLGMSGGKDSLVTAKLCADAIGKENVIGIIMPNGEMKDCSVAKESCDIIGIRYYEVNIGNIYGNVIDSTTPILKKEGKPLSTVTTFNVPPRLRMVTLYSIAGSLGYLVANTSNLSEGMVGYTTKWGDNVGDFGPLANFTKEEVCEIGILLGLPDRLVNKIPDDGLSGQSDEEKLGFSYAELDNFIRHGKKGEKFDKISHMHKISQHKRIGVVKYENDLKNYFDEDERDV